MDDDSRLIEKHAADLVGMRNVFLPCENCYYQSITESYRTIEENPCIWRSSRLNVNWFHAFGICGGRLPKMRVHDVLHQQMIVQDEIRCQRLQRYDTDIYHRDKKEADDEEHSTNWR